jgi:hypothetical protein
MTFQKGLRDGGEEEEEEDEKEREREVYKEGEIFQGSCQEVRLKMSLRH